MSKLTTEFGRIDVYLFDQLLRGNIVPGARILDAGCGSGRNLVYFLRNGYRVFGVDENPSALSAARELAESLSPEQAGNFRAESIEAMSFDIRSMDVVLSSAVLHFARDEAAFSSMLDAMWRVLVPHGLFFCRLASVIGMEDRVEHLGGRRFISPDGVERYLVDEATLLEATHRLGGTLADPIKTTVVSNQRCMTTWVVRKNELS